MTRASLLVENKRSIMTKGAARIGAAFERQLEAIVHDKLFAGLEIVDFQVRPAGRSLQLRATIDREGGVDLSLCERVAGFINAGLATCDDAYTLEVESAGLDRPLRRSDDYARFAGQRARIVTTLTVSGNKTHRGILRGLRGEAVAIETESGELLLPMAAIKSARLEYDPRIDFQRDKLQRKNIHGHNRKHGN